MTGLCGAGPTRRRRAPTRLRRRAPLDAWRRLARWRWRRLAVGLRDERARAARGRAAAGDARGAALAARAASAPRARCWRPGGPADWALGAGGHANLDRRPDGRAAARAGQGGRRGALAAVGPAAARRRRVAAVGPGATARGGRGGTRPRSAASGPRGARCATRPRAATARSSCSRTAILGERRRQGAGLDGAQRRVPWHLLYLGGNHDLPPAELSDDDDDDDDGGGGAPRRRRAAHRRAPRRPRPPPRLRGRQGRQRVIQLRFDAGVLALLDTEAAPSDIVLARDYQPRFPCFVLEPRLATQRRGHSDIRGEIVDYAALLGGAPTGDT
ncbi:hypothetical protein JL720_17334 [Aureococcus anophagefferens]|nr:hypothetical protein JL720_17334 [Aureococcus anophagefferens]